MLLTRMPTTSPLKFRSGAPACAALGRKVDPQMRGRKIAAEKFPIKPGDHSETGCFGKIERKANGHNRRGDFNLFGLADGQGGRRDVRLQDRDATAHIGHHQTRGICLAVEFDRQVFSITADGISGVERARGIDEETGAGEIAVLVGPADLYDGFRRTSRRSSLTSRLIGSRVDGSCAKPEQRRQKTTSANENRSHRRKERPEKRLAPG